MNGQQPSLFDGVLMKLRTITDADLDLWIYMQCDPVMIADLVDAQPLEKMPQILNAATNGICHPARGV
jgi:hypothetical protein